MEIRHFKVQRSARLEPGMPADKERAGNGTWEMLKNVMQPYLVDTPVRITKRQQVCMHIGHVLFLNGMFRGRKIDIYVAVQILLATAKMQFQSYLFAFSII